jgi:hypothetical protein
MATIHKSHEIAQQMAAHHLMITAQAAERRQYDPRERIVPETSGYQLNPLG